MFTVTITEGMQFGYRQIGMEGPWTVEEIALGRATMRKQGATWTTSVPLYELRDAFSQFGRSGWRPLPNA